MNSSVRYINPSFVNQHLLWRREEGHPSRTTKQQLSPAAIWLPPAVHLPQQTRSIVSGVLGKGEGLQF